VEDWNEAFNYSSNLGFLQQCLSETRGKIRKSVNAPICLEVLVEFIDVYSSIEIRIQRTNGKRSLL